MELTGRRFGHIRVTEVVGQGGMGDVYAGYDEKLERKVALKVLNSDQRLDDEARERLLREARALSKLEHPNICRIHDYIETGDVDLLVLEFIDGKTLHEAMMERMPRAEKLRIATAIAEVLVQAHRAGIVHRDLKPENVMLTRSGEVKVLDFGLARWLNRARARSSDRYAAVSKLSVRTAAVAPAPADQLAQTMALPQPGGNGASTNGRRAFLATAVGITLGTPLYMSPEQARGETLTPASDMFSFGLLLQVLFTGMEPQPESLTAREVILRVARGVTEPVQGASRDITALINRLKQFAPADRPTAVEVVERLRFLDEKPRRIARRAVIAAVVLFALLGAWRYTVDLKAERAIAEGARVEAEHRRAQAEDLIEFMLGDLRQKLEPVGRLDVLDDVAQRALAYVRSLTPNQMAPGELARTSKALNQLVEVRIAQSKLDEALELARQSVRLTEIAVSRAGEDGTVQLAYGTSHFWLGEVHRRRGEIPAAVKQMRVYQTVTARLAARHPENETYQAERSYGHSVLASTLEAEGKLPEALEQHLATREIMQGRLLAKPDDPERQADLASTDNRIGFVQYRLGHLAEARRAFERELATWRRLSASDPKNAKWQAREARSLSYMVGILESEGDLAGATELARTELDIHAKLAARDPQNAQWQRFVTNSQVRYGTLLAALGDHGAARVELEKAEQLAATVLSREEDLMARHSAFASIALGRSRMDMARGDYASAATALTTVRASLQARGRESEVAASWVEADLLTGDLLAARGDLAGARAHWKAADRRVTAASALGPHVLKLRAAALVRLGERAAATELIERMYLSGYRHPDLINLRRRVAERDVPATAQTSRR